MKGVDPSFYQHRVNLKKDVVLVARQRYKRNPNYAKQVKEELDELLQVDFIYPLDAITWLSPIIIVPAKREESDPSLDLFVIPYWMQLLDLSFTISLMVLVVITRLEWHLRIEVK